MAATEQPASGRANPVPTTASHSSPLNSPETTPARNQHPPSHLPSCLLRRRPRKTNTWLRCSSARKSRKKTALVRARVGPRVRYALGRSSTHRGSTDLPALFVPQSRHIFGRTPRFQSSVSKAVKRRLSMGTVAGDRQPPRLLLSSVSSGRHPPANSRLKVAMAFEDAVVETAIAGVSAKEMPQEAVKKARAVPLPRSTPLTTPLTKSFPLALTLLLTRDYLLRPPHR